MSVLLDALDAKGLTVASYRNDELVVLDVELLPLDLRPVGGGADVSALIGLDPNRLVLEVDA